MEQMMIVGYAILLAWCAYMAMVFYRMFKEYRDGRVICYGMYPWCPLWKVNWVLRGKYPKKTLLGSKTDIPLRKSDNPTLFKYTFFQQLLLLVIGIILVFMYGFDATVLGYTIDDVLIPFGGALILTYTVWLILYHVTGQREMHPLW